MALLAQMVEDVVAHRFEITGDTLTLGRHPSNAVQINEEAVSGRHAIIEVQRNADFKAHKEYYLKDLGSTNGTYLNGQRVLARVRLHHNDVIRLAWNEFRFIDEQEVEFEKTVHMIGET